MNAQLGNIVFIVWRESIEALLVIGILNAWLSQQGEAVRRGRLFLWAGVAAGIVTAFALGFIEGDIRLVYQLVRIILEIKFCNPKACSNLKT